MIDLKSHPKWAWSVAGTLVVVVGGLWLSSSTRGGGKAEAAVREMQYSAKVERIRNGASVKLKDGRKLKYAGIRTPYPNEPLFEEAKARNAELVEDKRVRLRYEGKPKQESDRARAYTFNRKGFINEILVREGLAYVRSTQSEQRFSDLLLEAQKKARRKGIGIWKNRKRSRESSYPADPKYGNYHRPSCVEVPKIGSDRLITFKSARNALQKGFAPCSKCKP